MSGSAEYLRVQYVPDLFRAEARNVGVIVKRDNEIAARFLGEHEPGGGLDGRTLRGFNAPNAYSEWVKYWRRVIAEKQEGSLLELIGTSGAHYRVIGGGEISDIGEDATADVLNYLYSRLVSEGGFAEAMRAALDEEALEEEAEIQRLDDQVTQDLEQLNILSRDTDRELFVPVPVRRYPSVRGLRAEYRPAYAQINGRVDVIETLDFTSRYRPRTRDHAGWMAYMFNDIRKAHGHESVTTISIVRVVDGLFEEHEELRAADAMLKAESDQVVNWVDEGERHAFLEERRRIALLEAEDYA